MRLLPIQQIKNFRNAKKSASIISNCCTVLLFGIFFLGSISDTLAQKKKNKREQKVVKTSLTYNQEQQFSRYYFDAIKEKALGNIEQELSLLDSAIKINPLSDAARYEKALALQRTQNSKDALLQIKSALAIKPDFEWYLQLLANLYEQNKEYKNAANTYARLSTLRPENVDFAMDEAMMLFYNGEFAEAIKVYEKIQRKTGINEEIASNKQKIFLKMGKIEEAANEFQSLIEENPTETRYYLMLGDLYSANNLKDKALEAYKKALEIDPKNGYAHLAMADYYQEKKDNKQAFEELKIAFEQSELDIDTKVRILFNYFNRLTQPESKAEALQLGEILTRVHPMDAKAHAIYGDVLFQTDDLLNARKSYEKAITFEKKLVVLWDQLSRIMISAMDFSAVVKLSEEALTYHPNQSIFYLYNGLAQLQLKNPLQAVTMLENGLSIGTEDKQTLSQLYSYLGDSFNELKKYSSSDSAYDESLKINPNQEYLLNNYSYYLSLRNEKLDKAEAMSRRSNELEPNNSSFLDTYAWILFMQGKYVDAKIWLDKAMINGGEKSSVVVEHLGDVLFKLGDVPGAVAKWELAKSYGAKSDILNKKIAEKRFIPELPN